VIKKIETIKNFGVFKDFSWDLEVKNGPQTALASPINIVYGRNYSGKTTLSRIFQAFETGHISDKYGSPEFALKFGDGSTKNHQQITGHGLVFRVFNDEFVKRNLGFSTSPDAGIEPFAVVGEENLRLEEEIAEIESLLGVEMPVPTGEFEKLAALTTDHSVALSDYNSANTAFEDKLRDKANNSKIGIKHNKRYGDANYNITKLNADIATVISASYAAISDVEASKLNALLDESAKQEIPKRIPFNGRLEEICIRISPLLSKEITISSPITELLSDSLLEKWVRDGRAHHEHKRSNCAFCGNAIDAGLWEFLSKHFDGESEALRSQLSGILAEIEAEILRSEQIPLYSLDEFYTTFHTAINTLNERVKVFKSAYSDELKKIKSMVLERLNAIHLSIQVSLAPMNCEPYRSIQIEFDALREESNSITSSLSKRQAEARTSLRLDDVFAFVTTINYATEKSAVADKKARVDALNIELTAKRANVDALKGKIAALRLQTKDETKGVEQVNFYLSSYFGHQYLKLDAYVAGDSHRFHVIRNESRAYHLSEGESSLIAFCYFMAKLQDVSTKGMKPYIWIDDPISSLDSNHIFFVFSLIRSELIKSLDFTQIFISTHNLDFLAYLKRISAKTTSGQSIEISYFSVDRSSEASTIHVMPKYLKNFVTEFNYLFHQIYKCAQSTDSGADFEIFYNFGNNARKFLELLMYYKFPDGVAERNGDDIWKLERYFGDDPSSAALVMRVNNELSHLKGLFERGMTPVEIPEMRNVANFIIQKIAQNDPDQCNALLRSIGISTPTVVA
jgi:wobble nucleotide-excising tRNase